MDAKESAQLREAFRAVRNFCSTYSRSDIEEMLNLYHRALSDNLADADSESKEHILDFFETLEELLPAVYEIEQARKKEIVISASN